jgi:NAD(P)-dependent dehydrogenase (short-subunit alcohol dehydrogenase family)
MTTFEGWNGRVAIVTGAAGGIGLGIARACAEVGMSIVMADIDRVRLAVAEEALQRDGTEVLALPTDVRSEASWTVLRDAAVERFGRVHLVCLNAGGPIPRSIEALERPDWTRVLELNLFGVVLGVRAFLPLLEGWGEGHLCATASMSGLVPFPPVATYNVAKAGVIAFMETLAHELRAKDSPIGVSLLCPGEVATRGVDNALRLASLEGHRPSVAERTIASRAQGGILDVGIDPLEVGRTFLAGVRAGKFWIFTHPTWVEGPLERRHRAMVEDGSLIDL